MAMMKSVNCSVHVIPEEAIDNEPLEAGETREDVYIKVSPRFDAKLRRRIAQAVERVVQQNPNRISDYQPPEE